MWRAGTYRGYGRPNDRQSGVCDFEPVSDAVVARAWGGVVQICGWCSAVAVAHWRYAGGGWCGVGSTSDGAGGVVRTGAVAGGSGRVVGVEKVSWLARQKRWLGRKRGGRCPAREGKGKGKGSAKPPGGRAPLTLFAQKEVFDGVAGTLAPGGVGAMQFGKGAVQHFLRQAFGQGL